MFYPQQRRASVICHAHDKSCHMGTRKVRDLINSGFTWPGLGKDVEEHVKSCNACLKINKAGNKTAKMMERSILSEPFERVAVDLVGPLPKGKGGAKYILTFVCMSSRWPEAVPMCTGSSSKVAEGLMSIFNRTGFPLRVRCLWVEW